MMQRSLVRATPLLTLSSAVLFVGCFHWRRQQPQQAPTPRPEAAPTISAAPSAPLPGASFPGASGAAMAEPVEPYVALEISDAPVKLILQRLADIGGLRLIIPANLNKTLTVQYVHVPVSVALNDVLKRSGLRLGTGPAANLPFDTVTV